MPHSSGGGSHSGGSHSGGSHHSSGGGSHSGGSHSYSSKVSKSYFPGAYRYVRTTNGVTDYVYSDNPDLGNDNSGIIRLVFGVCYIPFVLVILSFMLHAFHIPHKLDNTKKDIQVNDYVSVLGSDHYEISRVLTDFYEKTGISVHILAVDSNVWEGYYNTLEDYAYDMYLNHFDDETGWLIVYSDKNKNGFDDWRFEGMQGDLTDGILTTNVTKIFNDNLTKYLTASSKYSKNQAFVQAFKDVTASCMQLDIDGMTLLFMFCVLIFIGFHCYIMIFRKNHLFKYRGYERCDNIKADAETVKEKDPLENIGRCEYCRGLYRIGEDLECPHCGAPTMYKKKTILNGKEVD